MREISSEEEAIPFIYLCLSKYDFSATDKANEPTTLLLSILFNHARNRWDFYQGEYKARQSFLKDQHSKGIHGQAFEKLKKDLESLEMRVITKAEDELQRRSSIPPRARNSSAPISSTIPQKS